MRIDLFGALKWVRCVGIWFLVALPLLPELVLFLTWPSCVTNGWCVFLILGAPWFPLIAVFKGGFSPLNLFAWLGATLVLANGLTAVSFALRRRRARRTAIT